MEEVLLPEPRKPDESECCGQGCRNCVFDLYEQELAIWKKRKNVSVLQQDDFITMSSDIYTECCIESVEPQCANNVSVYHFTLPANTKLTFTAGQHLIVREGELARPYTLISSPAVASNTFTVLIKLYEDGPMSRIIREKWCAGYKVFWRGPLGSVNYQPNMYRDILLIAAGTGIAPLYQLAKLVTDNADDETRVKLLYGCRNYQEILLRPELQCMQSYWNFTVRYFLSRDVKREADSLRKHNEDITYSRLTEDDIVKEISVFLTGKFRVYLCGPKEFEREMSSYLVKIMDSKLIDTF